jgi:hypothetical protein
MQYDQKDLVGVIDKLSFVTIKPSHFIQKYEENGKIKIKDLYRIGKKIETGSFSTVRLALSRQGATARAVKTFRYNSILDN